MQNDMQERTVPIQGGDFCFVVACAADDDFVAVVDEVAYAVFERELLWTSGIFMAMVFGGVLIPVQGFIADKIGILNSYWFSIALLAYVLFYALVGSRVKKN